MPHPFLAVLGYFLLLLCSVLPTARFRSHRRIARGIYVHATPLAAAALRRLLSKSLVFPRPPLPVKLDSFPHSVFVITCHHLAPVTFAVTCVSHPPFPIYLLANVHKAGDRVRGRGSAAAGERST